MSIGIVPGKRMKASYSHITKRSLRKGDQQPSIQIILFLLCTSKTCKRYRVGKISVPTPLDNHLTPLMLQLERVGIFLQGNGEVSSKVISCGNWKVKKNRQFLAENKVCE